MEVSGIVVGEDNGHSNELPESSNSYNTVTISEMENPPQESLSLPSLIEKETEVEKNFHHEKVLALPPPETDPVEEVFFHPEGESIPSSTKEDIIEEEQNCCENMAETLKVEGDPIDQETFHCDQVTEILGTENDPVVEDCEEVAESFETVSHPLEEENSESEKGAESGGVASEPVHKESFHCEEVAESFGTESHPVEEENSECEKGAESLGVASDPVNEVPFHCEEVAEALGTEILRVEEKNTECEKVAESLGVASDPVDTESFHCEEVAESLRTESHPVEGENSECEKVGESGGVASDPVDKVILHCEEVAESCGTDSHRVEEENFECEKVAESLGVASDPVDEETFHCEEVTKSIGAESNQVERTFLSEKVSESLAPVSDIASEANLFQEDSLKSIPNEKDIVDEDNTPCIILPESPTVEENEVTEEEIPLAEAVTLYCHDVDSIQYSVDSQSSDPLAFDQENGDPSSIIIKDEPIDDREEIEVLPTEDTLDEMCIKIENVQQNASVFSEIASLGDKEYAQNSNLDNIQSTTYSENDYSAFLQNPNDFTSEISTLDNVSKLRVKDFDMHSEGISQDVILGHEQFIIDDKQENKWHSVTILKQEDGQENIVNSNKNQAMNSYMVNIPHLGFNKCKTDTIPGVFACEFCGKAFRKAAAHNGHLSKCPQRKRYRTKKLNFINSRKKLKREEKFESKLLSLPSSQQLGEESKPTIQLRNPFNAKKNYLHYDCDLCEKAFPTLQGFALHSRRHVEARKDFKCLNCRESFSTKAKLSLHCKRSGHRCKKFKCSFCSNTFYTKLSLSKHEQVHEMDETYVYCCAICDKSFENSFKLQKHQEKCQLAEKNYQDFKKSTVSCSCSVCGQTYKSAKRLIRHMKWHANEKHNACPVCKKKFLNKNNLKEHKLVHQAEGKYCCDMCDQVFENFAYLRKHVFRHTGHGHVASTPTFTCDKCHQSYSSISGLWGHSAHCRGKRMKKKKFITGDKSTRASKFNNYRPVQNEVIILNSKIKIKIKREETSQVLKNIDVPPSQDSKFKLMKCDLCKKSFSSRRNLDRHRQIHLGQMVRDTENTVLCGICGNLFSSNLTLLRHERLHRVGKQFQCLICRKLFPASRNLKIHMHSHRTEDKELFNCDICNKAFSSEIHLKYHRRAHGGSRSHKCQKCHKSFTTFQGLNGHRRFCPFRNSALEHTSTRVGESPKEYTIKQNVFLTPPSTIKRNNNEKSVPSILLKSKALQDPLSNACNICSKKFSSQVLLKYHLRQHSSEASLTCFNCKKTFETHRGLAGHFPHCPVRHIVMAGLQSRMDETLQCHICEKTTNNLENFMSHMRTHAKDLSFSCDFCGKVLSTSQARRIHIKRHHGGSDILMSTQPVKSVTPVRRTTSKQATNTSLRYGISSTSHSPRNVVSVKNTLPISELSSLETNYKKYFKVKRGSLGSEKYECKICNKELLSKKNLKFHSYIHSGDSPYKCVICEAIMHSRTALRTHINRKHGMSSHTNISDEVDYVSPKNLKNRTGKIKDKNIPNKLNSLFLKEEILPSSSGKVFQCNFCPRTFGGISKLQTHEASHLRALRCSVCGGSFRTHREFKEHVCADNFFPLLCEHCGVQFTEESSFASHRCDIE